MARVAPIELDDSKREILKAIIKKGGDWRERDRVETILLLASGDSIKAVAERQDLCRGAGATAQVAEIRLGQFD